MNEQIIEEKEPIVKINDKVKLKHCESIVTVVYTAQRTFDYEHKDGTYVEESGYDVIDTIIA